MYFLDDEHQDIETDPHRNSPVLTTGLPPEQAAAVIVMLHSRGASAANMLGLFNELGGGNKFAAVIPQAHEQCWYPKSLLGPLEENQPYLDSALGRVDSIMSNLLAQQIDYRKIVILGFSEGACLGAEYVARHPRRYGAVIVLTGGLLGPPDNHDYPGDLEGTPIFIGINDPDAYVPFHRAKHTGAVLQHMNGAVELRRYPRMPHTINKDELETCRLMLLSLTENHRNGGPKAGECNGTH